MTYIVNEKCIKCKLMDCVEVCPVDCFYEGKNMLVIKPDECIDCGVCEPECPIDAIEPDTNKGAEKWLDINKKNSEIWPNISEKKEPPIITSIKKTKDKLLGELFRENPTLDILLVKDKNNLLKLFSKFKNTKKIINKNKK